MTLMDRRQTSLRIVSFPFAANLLGFRNVYAAPAAQRDWRFCAKCNVMFFDGSADKGRCAAGGAHQAAGFVFVLPHDGPETATAQHNWRFCGKCHSMFFDGFAQKGVCPGGGSHQAIGFNFVLPHSGNETPTAQRNWRFCGKCNSLFFDGGPNKGKCPKDGGGHAANGLNFILPHEKDPFVIALESMWRDVGRGIVTEKIRQEINGREFRRGFSGHDANVTLSDISASWRRTSPTSISIELRLPGNNAEFQTTQPTILGSGFDPKFRVGFDMLVELNCGVQTRAPLLTVQVVQAKISNAGIHGSNASGTIVETVADFFTSGGFTREVTRQINDDHNLKAQIQRGLDAAFSKIPNVQIPA